MLKKFYTINVDGNLIKIFNTTGLDQLNLLQYLHQLGKDIPHFCYHERLGIAGNCRMCLIQTNLAKKLQVACSLIMSDGLIVNMLSARVKRAQESVLGFLLSNHPLDCPICDQGGECDLQDLTLLYGGDRNNFYEVEKRSVLDKNFGVLIKSSMNRCIHCMRCVRFYKDIVGMPLLSAIGRGYRAEIDTYILNFLDDEFSGNIVDLCPVGALTAKVYAYQYRAWELQNIKTVDFLDSLNAPISFNIFGNKLIRVLPEINYLVNDNWITNKTRFAYELLNIKRISKGLWVTRKRRNESHFEYLILANTSIAYLFYFLFFNIQWTHVFPILASVTEMLDLYSFKRFLHSFGILQTYVLENSVLSADFRSFYVLYWGLEDFKYFSSCILLGLNPRMEAPLLNLRFRQLWLNHKVLFMNFGPTLHSLSFHVINISKDLFMLYFLLEGKSAILRSFFFNLGTFLPFFFLGATLLKHNSSSTLMLVFLAFLKLFQKNLNLGNYWRFTYNTFDFFSLFAILPPYSITLHKNELGLQSKAFFKSLKVKVTTHNFCMVPEPKYLVYFFGLGYWSKISSFLRKSANFCIYQGVIFENLDYTLFDLLIPNLGFYEKTSLSLNFVQDLHTTASIFKYEVNVLSADNFFKELAHLYFKGLRYLPFFFRLPVHFFNTSNDSVYLNLYQMRVSIDSILNVFSLNKKKLCWVNGFFFLHRKFFMFNEKVSFQGIKFDLFSTYLSMYSLEILGCLQNNLVNNYLLNYFDECDSFFIKNSKTMNLCMLSYSKRNFSFFL